MNSIEKRLESLGFNGISANFRMIMTLSPPNLGAYGRILRDLDRSLQAAPACARLHALKGKALSNLSRYSQARLELERSIALDRSCAVPLAWLGETYLLENRIIEAVKRLDEALRLNPHCAWAYFYRSAARYVMGKTDQAHEDLRRILSMGKEGDARVAAKAFLSLLEAKAGRFAPALARINEVRGSCPRQAWPYVLRAAVHRLRGNKRAALRDVSAALKGRAEGWICMERAVLHEEMGHPEEALRDLAAARKLDGLSLAICLRRGRLHLARKRYGLALKDLRRSLTFEASRESLGFGLDLARELQESERRGERVQVLKELARGFPGDPEVRRVLKQAGDEKKSVPGGWSLLPYFQRADLLLARGDIRAMRGVLKDARRRFLAASDCGVLRLIERFQLAVRLGDYEEAGRMGEAALDRTRRREHLDALAVPFLPAHDGIPLSPGAASYLRRALREVERAIARHPRSPWGYYIGHQWRAVLRQPQDREAALRFRRFPKARYGWMRALAAHSLLYERRFQAAIKQFEAARDFSRPPDWRCQCYIAEALIYQGKPAAAWSAFGKAEKLAGRDLGQVRAWKAEALLWLGRYRAALRILNAVPNKMESPYALCWKGAALSKLGRLKPALAALDAAISRFPQDSEARVWRAETLLRAGRAAEAAREAQAALSCAGGDQNHFALAVKGLARAALGDAAGMEEDFRDISMPIIRSIRRRLASAGERSPEKRRILEKILEFARGNRRGDVALLLDRFAARRLNPSVPRW